MRSSGSNAISVPADPIRKSGVTSQSTRRGRALSTVAASIGVASPILMVFARLRLAARDLLMVFARLRLAARDLLMAFARLRLAAHDLPRGSLYRTRSS